MDATSTQLVRVATAFAGLLRRLGLDHSHVTPQVRQDVAAPRRHSAPEHPKTLEPKNGSGDIQATQVDPSED